MTAKIKSLGKVSILVAEDDEDDFLLLRDALRKGHPGIDIEWVKDGVELMGYLSLKIPSLIFLDLNMPKKDGCEALKEIRSNEKFRSVPIIIFTTSENSEDIRYTYALGGNTFIRKPSGFSELMDFMKIFDKYWFEVARLPKGES